MDNNERYYELFYTNREIIANFVHKQQHMINVLLLNDLSREPARQLVTGISRFGNSQGGWRFYQVPQEVYSKVDYMSNVISMVKNLDINAIFGQWHGIDVQRAKKLGIPIFLYQREEKILDFPIVRCNNDAVGKMVANHLLGLGIANITFCGIKGVVWSSERLESFKTSIGSAMLKEYLSDDEGIDWLSLRDWLKKLPKPVAIFACNDVIAKTLIEVCLSSGMKVPDEVAVLGVDDDSFICNITTPTISTVKLDFEGIGYKVGSKIERAIMCGEYEEDVILHEPVRIIERESTPPLQIKDPYVRRVLDYLHKHYSEDISINDAIRDIPLSRRSIEIRFRKEMSGKTMLHTLTELRIEKMKSLLEQTDEQIFNAAIISGFNESTNINRVFKASTGYAPREYRLIHKKGGGN